MISKLRERIDELDKRIVSLISERMQLSEKIGLEKRKSSSDINDASRESVVLENVSSQARDAGLDPGVAKTIFRLVISHSKALQEKMNNRPAPHPTSDGLRIATLGPEGSFSEAAAKVRLRDAKMVYLPCIKEVFSSVASGDSDLGVVPVENSTEGSVSETLDCLLGYDLSVTGEVLLPVEHALFLNQKTSLDKVRKVFAHPLAAAQCRSFLSDTLNGVEIVPCSSSSHACSMAAKEPGSAAIGSSACASLYGISLCFKGIQDVKDNTTRFFVIENRPFNGKADKTSLIVSVKNVPGSLYKALGIFSKSRINMTKIESRPVKDDFGSYIFYIDIEGSIQDKVVCSALSQLEADSNFVKRLGSYKAAG